MERDVQARIRALPGNNVCVDCPNLNPQWASISYGSLMCLECSGHHRSIGVHLSFVRSIQMDSWTERQIKAIEMSGGNKKVVEFFGKREIDKGMQIAQKYNSKQAAFFRDQLKANVDGKAPTMSDPGRFDPATAAPSVANGVEAKAGETVDEYNARQIKMKEDARARLAAKFGGNGGMGGVGSQGNSSQGGFQNGRGSGDGEGLGAVLGGVGCAVGGLAAGGWGFLKEKVIDNENVRDKVGGLAQLAGNAVGAVRNTVRDGDTLEALKRNITLQEGSLVNGGVQWARGDNAHNVYEKSPGMHDMYGQEHRAPTTAPVPGPSRSNGTEARSTNGDSGSVVKKKSDALDSFNFDDDWGDDAPAKADPTKDDMALMAKQMGMTLSNGSQNGSPPKAAPRAGAANGGYPAAAAPPAAPSKADQEETKRILAIKAMDLKAPEKKVEPKKKAGLASSDDFFADFEM